MNYALKKWKNPYIDLVDEHEDAILTLDPERTNTRLGEYALSAPSRELLREKQELFKESVLELGSGSGGHLIERAKLEPQTLFIGVELRFKRAVRTIEKAKRDSLTNLLILRGTAESISDIFPPRSISRVYVNFPDPWSKKRWTKHRMLNEERLITISKLLRQSGALLYKTDHKEYFYTTLELLESLPMFAVEYQTPDLHNSPYLEGSVQTEFESLFLSQGLPIYALKAGVNEV